MPWERYLPRPSRQSPGGAELLPINLPHMLNSRSESRAELSSSATCLPARVGVRTRLGPFLYTHDFSSATRRAVLMNMRNLLRRKLALGGILSPGNRAALGALIATLVVSCAGGAPTGQSPFLAFTADESDGRVNVSPSTVDFGVIRVGANATQLVTLTNSDSGRATVDQVETTGSDFQISGLPVPLVLEGGQSAAFLVTFSPSIVGSVSGSISLSGSASNSPTLLTLAGPGNSSEESGQLTIIPSTVDFGDVAVDDMVTREVALDNQGNASLTILQADISSPDFLIGGLSLPLTLAAGPSIFLTIGFAPSVSGAEVAGVSFVTDSSPAPNTLLLSGNGVLVPGTLSFIPGVVDFGDVTVGDNVSQGVVLSNSGRGPVNVSAVSVNGAGFSVGGFSLPVVLAAGASTTFGVNFSPLAAGSSTASVSVTSDASNSPTSLSLTGNGISAVGTLVLTPASVDFGDVAVGAGQARTITLGNSGSGTVTVSEAQAVGSAFSVSGIPLPLVLVGGGSATFSVSFAPVAGGSVAGSVTLVSNASNAPNFLSLTGNGLVATGTLSCSSTTLNFGDVVVGTGATRAVTLTNSGEGGVTITQADCADGADFSLGVLPLPLTLSSGQTTTFPVAFTPATVGAQSATLSLVSDAANSPTTLSVTGNGVRPAESGQLTVHPVLLDFGDVTAGTSQGQAVTLTNSGNGSLTVGEISVIGTEFSVTGMAIPLTLGVGESATLSVAFEPPLVGSVTGSISLTSDAANSPTLISLAGNGVSSNGLLSLTPASLDFGDVTVGSSATRSVTLTSSGSTVVLVSTSEVTGAEFSVAGLALPLNLSPGETVTFSLTLTPTAAGSVNGNVALASDASNSPTVVSLTGNGIDAVTSKVVDLLWDPSISVVDGYNVYRSTVSGGPYTKMNATLVLQSTFADDTVQAGETYFYVVVAVDADGVQSRHSNEAQASIP